MRAAANGGSSSTPRSTPNYEGQGLGAVLVKGALADVRASGRRAVPVCPFVAAYVKRHPEEADIVDRATPAILSSL